MPRQFDYAYAYHLNNAIKPEDLNEVILLCGNYDENLIPNTLKKAILKKYFVSNNHNETKLAFYSTDQAGVTIADFGKRFLEEGFNEDLCFMDKLHLLSFAKTIRVVFLFSDQHSDLNNIINTMKRLSTIFGQKIKDRNSQEDNQLIDKFAQSIGFMIINPKTDAENYKKRLQPAPGSKDLQTGDQNGLIKSIFKSVMKDKLFLMNEEKVLERIVKNIPELNFGQDKKLQQKIVNQFIKEGEDGDIARIINNIFQEQCDVLQQIISDINDKKFFSEGSNLKAILNKIIKLGSVVFPKNNNKIEKEDQGILVAMQIVKDIAQIINNICQSNGNLCFSICGEIIKKFANYSFFNNNSEILEIGNLMGYSQKTLQILPIGGMRQKNSIDFRDYIKPILEKIIQHVGQNFEPWVDNSKLNSPNADPKVMNKTIKSIQLMLQGWEIIAKTNFLTEAEIQNQSYLPLIQSYLVEMKLKLYYRMGNHWTRTERNNFLLGLEKDLRSCQYSLRQGYQSEAVKEIYSKLGDICFQKQSYQYAIELYHASMSFYKEKNTIEEWLKKRIARNRNEFNREDSVSIRKDIWRLVELGFAQEARAWCYRFMEVCSYEFSLDFMQQLSDIMVNKDRAHERFLGEMNDTLAFCSLLDETKMANIKADIAK